MSVVVVNRFLGFAHLEVIDLLEGVDDPRQDNLDDIGVGHPCLAEEMTELPDLIGTFLGSYVCIKRDELVLGYEAIRS